MAGRLPTKISVTELKRHFDSEIQEEYTPAALAYVPLVKKPLFLEETKGFSAAERGSIMHFSMQHLNLSKVSSLQEIKLQINGMVENELLTRQQSQAVDIDKIFKFFSSPIGRRMVNAHRVYREMPFNIELKSTEIHKDLPKELYENETMLLQGVIDCFFEEDRELVLLDYKTDYVSPDGMEAIRKGYETQILYYTRALEKITGKRVKEKYIYLFWNGNIIEYK
jgi:ATP-dependent helicase/nuclease subunit A